VSFRRGDSLFPPLSSGFLFSLFVHGTVFWWVTRRGPKESFSSVWAPPETIEVDLTRPFRLTSDPAKAFRSSNPGTGRPKVDQPTPGPFKEGGGVAQQGQTWTLPTPNTTAFDTKPVEGNPLSKSTAPSTGTGTVEGPSQGLGGLGTGGEGEVDWVYLTEQPRLLNKKELIKNIRRFYPETERQAGREGFVAVHVHLNKEGSVSSVDIAQSAGALFDEAARRVLSLAKFSPAKAGDRPVAVKFGQSIDFRLEE